MNFTISRIDAEPTLPALAGGKASGLQLIKRAGLDVPDSWVLIPVTTEQTGEILETAFGDLGEPTYAVRSSAVDEDSDAFSFAGIHESRLGVAVGELADAAIAVAESALSDRARAYREGLGLPQPTGRCAVVLQKMVESDCAGVAFSAGERGNFVMIEAVQGIGDAAVDGSVRPEVLYVERSGDTWHLRHRVRRNQSVASAMTASGVSRVSLPAHAWQTDVVTLAQAVGIASGVKKIEECYGKPVDVEWAWADGKLWFLQARNRTRPLTDELPSGDKWTRANARDVLPEVPSAFCRGMCRSFLDAGVREHLLACGVRTEESKPLFTTILGRPVFNERAWLPGDRLGIPREVMQSEFGGTADADDSVGKIEWRRLLGHPLILFRVTRVAFSARRRSSEFLDWCQQTRQELESIRLESATATELLDAVRLKADILGRAMVRNAMAVAVLVSNAHYMVLTQLRKHPSPRAIVARLLAHGDATVSMQQLEDLAEIADAMRGWDDSERFAREITDDHKLRPFWEAQLPSDLWSQIHGWLERYGHRGPYESDLSSPRYGEDLRLLAEALFPLVRGEAIATTAARRETRRAELNRAWNEIERTYGRRRRRSVEKRLTHLKSVLRLRELIRSEAVRATLPIRAIVLELGRRLKSAGKLSNLTYVWHLTLDQLERAFQQQAYSVEVAVLRELSRKAAWRRITVPNRFSSEDVGSIAANVSTPANTDDISILRGNGISPGLAEGVVCALTSPLDGDRIMSGAILVAPATDPGWTPLFTRAAAVVVEIGGALSHAGIVAREYGIPCVANINGLMSTLHDGDVVTVDGTMGTVRVVDRHM